MDTSLRPTTGRQAVDEPRAIAQRRAAPGGPEHPSRLPGLLLALPVSVLTLVIVLPGLGRRALWNDEYATWYVSTLSPSDLLRLLNQVDAVLAPYYVFMHAWIAAFGDSPASLRLPSALAMAVATGLTALIGRRLCNATVGLAAGVLLACLPAVSRYAQEARPYAMVMASTVLATLLLLRSLPAPAWRRWWGYAAAMCSTALLHFVALTVLVPHAYLVLRSMHTRRDFRILRWFAALAVVVTVVLPLAAKGAGQTGAIDWIRADGTALAQLPGKTFGSGWVALVMVIMAGLGAAVLSRRDRDLTVLLVGWALFPPVFCYLSFPLLHLLLYRYLLFTLPAYCLLAAVACGAALHRIRGGGVLAATASIALIGAVAVAGMHGQRIARLSPVQGEPDFRAAAAVVEAGLQPGDGVAYAGIQRNGRRAFKYELRHRTQPRDVFVAVSPEQHGDFGAVECQEPGGCAGDTRRIWFVSTAPESEGEFAQMPAATATLLREEFTRAGRWHLPNVRVTLLVRQAAP